MVERISKAAAEMQLTDGHNGLVDPIEDLKRIQRLYDEVQEATRDLRHESVFLRSVATARTLDAGAIYRQVEAVLGVARQRVYQIAQPARDAAQQVQQAQARRSDSR